MLYINAAHPAAIKCLSSATAARYRAAMDDELDSRHIARVAGARRSAMRARSYSLIALLGAVAAFAELLFLAGRRIYYGFGLLGAALELLAAIAVLFSMRWLWRSFQRLNHEAKSTAAAPPAKPPDFSTLGDGSQFARNLHHIE